MSLANELPRMLLAAGIATEQQADRLAEEIAEFMAEDDGRWGTTRDIARKRISTRANEREGRLRTSQDAL